MSDKHSKLTPREFLDQLFGPELRRHLVAISEGGDVIAATFQPTDAAGLEEWVAQHYGMDNLYFSVNRLRSSCVNRKARKEDVEAGLCLHVDVDDPKALARVAAFLPQPTAVVFSGGGYQAFWLLEVETKDLSRVERINKTIADSLGGDHCHNIDRIMRLPGTINVPNKKKRDAGRVPTQAYVVDEATDWSRRYDLDDFNELEGSVSFTGTIVSPASIVPFPLDDLPASVSEMTRGLIRDGDDISRPLGSVNAHFSSRSEVVFRVACDLARSDCSIEVIAGILLNPEHGVSASVLEKNKPADYALRQADRALVVVDSGWPDVAKNGAARSTFRNAMLALMRLGLQFSFNLFSYRKLAHGVPLQEYAGELSDDLCHKLRQMVIERFGFDPGKENVRDATHTLCLENPFHPICQYLDSLVWDGIPRVDNWLPAYLGAEPTVLNAAIGKIVLVAAVRRVREPGAKFDTIMVLESSQGGGKSTAIRILAGEDNFSDQEILSLDSKAQMEALEGVWFYELAELEGIGRADIGKVKAFASRAIDQSRMAYGRFKERRPRQNVLIGTTNDDKYLRDPTGNRRFWPLKVDTIDLDGLERDRDQLWAEAALLETKGEGIVLPRELWPLAQAEQEARMEDDPWFDELALLDPDRCDLVSGNLRITSQKILTELIGLPLEHQKQFHTKRLAGLMRKLGWEAPRPLKMKDGSVVRAYQRPSGTDEPDRSAKVNY